MQKTMWSMGMKKGTKRLIGANKAVIRSSA